MRLIYLTAASAALYFFTLGALLSLGLHPAIPWLIGLLLLVSGLPCAAFLSGSVTRIRPAWIAIVCGPLALLVSSPFIWLALGLGLPFVTRKPYQRNWTGTLLGLLALLAGLASLWNLNYLAVHFQNVVHDPFVRALDLKLYPGFGISGYREIFPLVRNAWLLQFLVAAYSFLFFEILLVLWLTSGDEKKSVRFLVELFSLYAIGLICFVVFPVIGPCVYYPESLMPAYPLAYASGMAQDFQTAHSTGELSGYGYFIALPSLHVMVSLFLQQSLAKNRALFWMFLPVSLLTVSSTFLLATTTLQTSLPPSFASGCGVSIGPRWR